jgi:hypothetical protein
MTFIPAKDPVVRTGFAIGDLVKIDAGGPNGTGIVVGYGSRFKNPDYVRVRRSYGKVIESWPKGYLRKVST